MPKEVEWKPGSEHPENNRAVFCITVGPGTARWIYLGTYQHGGWRDTNSFEKKGEPTAWCELPVPPEDFLKGIRG